MFYMNRSGRKQERAKSQSFAFRLDVNSGVLVYRQLIDLVQAAVASGVLTLGSRLSTVRQVGRTAVKITSPGILASLERLSSARAEPTRPTISEGACFLAPSELLRLASFLRRSSDRIPYSGIESVAFANEFKLAFPAMASLALASLALAWRSGCDTTLDIRNGLDSVAGAWRAPEEQRRVPSPPRPPGLVVPMMAASF
jgi:hypothetical protein